MSKMQLKSNDLLVIYPHRDLCWVLEKKRHLLLASSSDVI